MIVTVTLQRWTGGEANWAYVVVPAEASDDIRVHAFENPRGFRSVRVECSVGDVTWRTSLFPRKDGGYFLPIKAEVRRRARLAVGDEVRLSLRLL